MTESDQTDISSTPSAEGAYRMTKGRKVFSKVRRRLFKHVILWRVLIVMGVFLVILLPLFFLINPLKKTDFYYYAHLAKIFITTPEVHIKSADERTNLLILGKGGVGHEAPDLTDTMMLASVNHKTSEFTLISFPRDIWVPSLEAKLNSVYYWGNKKQAGGGLILAKSEIEEIAGTRVDYALVIDFSGFRHIIDVIGGINVDVQNSFTDPKYPITGRENDVCGGDLEYKCRYETITFDKGTQHMNGETALKFVRSRNAEGDEGTDLARAARQQQVISAIKDKVLSKEILFHPKKMFELKDAVLESVETDLSPEAVAVLARRAFNSKLTTKSYVLAEDLLEVAPKSPIYLNLYVFIPKGGNWDGVHKWVGCKLGMGSECI